MDNKTNLKKWATIIALVIWVGLTIATCAGLWNAATKVKVEGFYITVSIINCVVNVAIAVFLGKKIWDGDGVLNIKKSKKE